MLPDLLEQVRRANDDASLRPTEELVTREADYIGARRQRLLHGRLVGKTVARRIEQGARAEIVHEDAARGVRGTGYVQQGRLLGETDDPEVGAMRMHDDGIA